MPDPKRVKVGVWEDGVFVGVVIFSRGVSATKISKTMGISSVEIAELSRVALSTHRTPTTRIVSIALAMLKAKDSGLRVIVSYADENQGHLGIIYQGGNWIYTGRSARVALFRDASGRMIHDRACSASGVKRQFGLLKRAPKPENLTRIEQLPKWRYFMPLDPEMRAKILPLAKPYPKRERSIGIDAAGTTSRGRCDATRSLQPEQATTREPSPA